LAKKNKKKQKSSDADDGPDSSDGDPGQLLSFGSRVFNDRTARKIQASGHTKVRVSHLALMRHIDTAGTRITELAKRAGMTKQAMGQLVREFQEFGYLELQPDPTDRRAKLATYTETGRRLADDAARAVADVQAEFKAALGKGGWKELRKLLGKVAKAFRTP
jgi:DNA-binding MarR family transcriptional regulator